MSGIDEQADKQSYFHPKPETMDNGNAQEDTAPPAADTTLFLPRDQSRHWGAISPDAPQDFSPSDVPPYTTSPIYGENVVKALVL